MADTEKSTTLPGRLEEALSTVLSHSMITGILSRVLAHAVQKGTICYQEIKEIVRDNPEDLILLADEWRLLLTVNTTKSSSWEDRLLLLKNGEAYEIPNIIQYLVRIGIHTGKWDPEKAIVTFFEELGDSTFKQIPELVRNISEIAVNHRISGNQIKMVCLRLGLSDRVDSLIAELKAAGIISPKLGSISETNREGSPVYELNPAVAIGFSS
ncbi:MAG: hypothetical protein JW944_06010 [Deltaproteobacteria bacterium]|nr:hypothetical protein [Deltaproteobacteria bacterium]